MRTWRYAHLSLRYDTALWWEADGTQEWSYDSPNGMVAVLDRVGADGWELVGTVYNEGRTQEYLFKRPGVSR